MQSTIETENSISPAVSIIIPVYNVDKYLLRCMDSIFAQTYKDFEVILVDDGSTDSSGKMCDDYAKMDNRIHAFHKQNGGLSDARNCGVVQSRGRFIIFVDSDDYVSDDYVEYLVQLIKMFNADVAVTGYVSYMGDDYYFNRNVSKEKCLTTEEALIAMMYKIDFTASACAKIYKRELVERYPYPVGCLYEDMATTYKIIADCKMVAYGDRRNYCYRQRKGSITHQNIDEKLLYGIKAVTEQLKYMEMYFPNIVSAAQFSVSYMIIGLMDNVIYGTEMNIQYFHLLRNELKPYFLPLLRDRNIKVRRKIRGIAVMSGYYPTLILWKLIDWLRGSDGKRLMAEENKSLF